MDSSTDLQNCQFLLQTNIDKPIRPPRSTDPATKTPATQLLCQHHLEQRDSTTNDKNCSESFEEAMMSENEINLFITSNYSQLHFPQNNSVTGYFGNKPTVQVHPMPIINQLGRSFSNRNIAPSSLSSSTSSISPPETLKKLFIVPPPVPKKPLQFGKRLETPQQLLLLQNSQQLFQEENEKKLNQLLNENSFEVKLYNILLF